MTWAVKNTNVAPASARLKNLQKRAAKLGLAIVETPANPALAGSF